MYLFAELTATYSISPLSNYNVCIFAFIIHEYELEMFEDTKGQVRIHELKNDKQHKRQRRAMVQNTTQKLSNTNLAKIWGWTRVPHKGKQSLHHYPSWNPLKVMKEDRSSRVWLQQQEYIGGHL